jgi:hypothetical protein
MKTKFIFSLLVGLFMITLPIHSQRCSNREPVAHFTMNYGIDKTLSADLAIVSESNFRYGLGAIVHVDNTIQESESISYTNFALGYYGVFGYQTEFLTFGATIGQIHYNPNERNVGTEHIKLPNTTEMLYGGFIGYRLSKRISINCGYNNLSNISFGVGFGIS